MNQEQELILSGLNFSQSLSGRKDFKWNIVPLWGKLDALSNII